jgi:hypothetical protein
MTIPRDFHFILLLPRSNLVLRIHLVAMQLKLA